MIDVFANAPGLIWGIFSVVMTIISFVPYISKTFKGTNKPHIFTWMIWTLVVGILYFVQDAGGAGPGAWASGVTALCCGIIVLASIRHGEKHITRLDWISFIAVLLIIPIWMLTDSPPLAAFLVTVIDGIAYIPTFTKSWRKPHEEVAFTHIIANVKHGLAMMAMQTISFTTIFYPVCIFFLNLALVGLIFMRRYELKPKSLNQNF